MTRQLSANLWLLFLTLLLCSVAYPLALLGIAKLPFLKDKAQGSLIVDGDKVIGSQLEGQAFESDEYFWPRPSAASYKGDASGGSNYSANNPDLRRRVENQLGTILKYGPKGSHPGKMIGPDIEEWFANSKGLVAQWANENASQAQAWVKENKPVSDFIDSEKKRKLTEEVGKWLKESKNEGAEISKIKPEDLAVPFLRWFSVNYSGSWPTVQSYEVVHKTTGEKANALKLVPVKTGREIRGFFCPLWRTAHPNEDLDPVPADMVTTSGSGLDPHITLKSALYQFDRVADKWAELRKIPRDQVAQRLHKLIDAHKHAPLGGLAGVELVNVMELNVALKAGNW